MAIALRAALRVFPIASILEDGDLRRKAKLAIFRATLVAQRGRSQDGASRAADAAVHLAGFVEDNNYGRKIVSDAIECAADVAYAASTSDPIHVVDIAVDAICLATKATAPMQRKDDSSLWFEIDYDCSLVSGNRNHKLLQTGLWQNIPSWFYDCLAVYQRSTAEDGYAWLALSVWYEQTFSDATKDPFSIKALNNIAYELPEFWGDGEYSPRSPDMVMDDIAGRLGWSPENQFTEVDLETEKEELEQRPAPHTYTFNKNRIDTNAGTSAHDAVGEAIYADVKEKAEKAKAAAGANTGEARLEETLDRFLEMLGGDLSKVNPGKALMSARTVQADISAFEAQGASDKLLGEALSALRDLNGSLDDFLGIFPEIQSINANALALKIQDSDVEAIRGLDAEIEAIAQQSDIVSDTAKVALKDGGPDVDSALDALRTAMSESAAAKALETAAKTMSVKLLSTRNFIAASVRTGMELSGKGAKAFGKELGEYAKDAGGRAREGWLDAIGASAKGLTTAAIASLVGMLTTPVVGMAVYVASFRALGKKAEKVSRDNEEVPDDEK